MPANIRKIIVQVDEVHIEMGEQVFVLTGA